MRAQSPDVTRSIRKRGRLRSARKQIFGRVDRSFDCVAVATTRWCSRFCLKPQLTEDQFLWLVQFFGGLPKWYYNWQPDRLEPV